MYKVFVQPKFPPTNIKIPRIFPEIPDISKFSSFPGFPEKWEPCHSINISMFSITAFSKAATINTEIEPNIIITSPRSVALDTDADHQQRILKI